MSEDGSYDFTIRQGKTFRRTMTWFQEEQDGDVVNLSGFTARMQVRPSHSSDEVILDLADGEGITLGGVAGTIALYISAEDTAALDFAGIAYYDLELRSSGGEVPEFLFGRVGLKREDTREDES